MTDLELWAGVECSMVRVGDRFVDEIELTGHQSRIEDLDRLAALGVRAVRYPALWERILPVAGRPPDWSFTDERLARLRELGIRPILGLVHHGSGPRHTSLVEDSFVGGLAELAAMVAERYPWVRDYTPVNEPLTTARFSGLYGHWYPHARSDEAFVCALLVQCRAIRAAMAAIRRVTPEARFVSTEDLGTVFATEKLAYQARFENRRRWASLDLLTGRIDAQHSLRAYLVAHGAKEDMLDSFVEGPCPPDILGMNHYVTSDRFLDERIGRYPAHVRGGNGIDTYADVEAVRVCGAGIPGHRALLQQLWARYRLPLAITEVHLGCAPEEQIRWLHEAWTGARDARAAGIDVRAVTAWSAFGASDWDSLLTQDRQHYEPGIFDVRGGVVRPTALARVCTDLATRGESDHPMLAQPGWWRRADRLLYPSFGGAALFGSASARRPILVTGAKGTLGAAVVRVAEQRGLAVVAVGRSGLDVADAAAVDAILDALHPWAVVNAAGYVRVDAAENDEDACLRTNAVGPGILAAACQARGIRLATFSSDLVFDGQQRAPYVESDAPSPLNLYGASKLLAERLVAERCPDAAIIRTSAFFGPWDEASFLHAALRALLAGRPFRATTDAVVSPTYVPHLADATLTLLVDGASGVWHLANPGAITWYELAHSAARLAGLPVHRLSGGRQAELGLPAKRPAYSALASARGGLLPPLEEALGLFVQEWTGEAVSAKTG